MIDDRITDRVFETQFSLWLYVEVKYAVEVFSILHVPCFLPRLKLANTYKTSRTVENVGGPVQAQVAISSRLLTKKPSSL
jgi:hypothetical protein